MSLSHNGNPNELSPTFSCHPLLFLRWKRANQQTLQKQVQCSIVSRASLLTCHRKGCWKGKLPATPDLSNQGHKCVWTWLSKQPSLLRQVTRQLPTLPTHLGPFLSSHNTAFPRGFSRRLLCARRKHSPGSKTCLLFSHSIIRHIQRHRGEGG